MPKSQKTQIEEPTPLLNETFSVWDYIFRKAHDRPTPKTRRAFASIPQEKSETDKLILPQIIGELTRAVEVENRMSGWRSPDGALERRLSMVNAAIGLLKRVESDKIMGLSELEPLLGLDGVTPTKIPIEKILAFRTLAIYFLDSMNPRPTKYVVIMDCILGYPGTAISNYPDPTLRGFAHDFCRGAERIIEFGLAPLSTSQDPPENGDSSWIMKWYDSRK